MGAANASPPRAVTLTAESALTRFRFVQVGAAANGVTACTAVTDVALGVMQETCADTEAASVWLLNEGGIVPIEAAAAIALGANIGPSLNGRGQTAVATQYTRGIALEAASAAGHVIPMLVQVEETVLT